MNYDALLAQINKIAGALQPLYSFIEFPTLLQSSTDIISIICQDYYGDYLCRYPATGVPTPTVPRLA